MIHPLGGFNYSTGCGTELVVLRQIINFAVATFPFIIWSLLYSGLELLKTVHSGNEIHWLGVIYRFIVGKSATPFYYIVVLMQLTVITPWIVKIVNENGIISKVLWLMTPVYLVYLELHSWNITTFI